MRPKNLFLGQSSKWHGLNLFSNLFYGDKVRTVKVHKYRNKTIKVWNLSHQHNFKNKFYHCHLKLCRRTFQTL